MMPIPFEDVWRAKLARAYRTRDAFDASRRSHPKWFRNQTFILFAAARANHWYQNALDNWEPWYSCDLEERLPPHRRAVPRRRAAAAHRGAERELRRGVLDVDLRPRTGAAKSEEHRRPTAV